MVELGISEFTFGFGFLYEQTHANWANLRATPVLPSLQREQHEGWDAHLPLNGIDYYYQFKLSDFLRHRNAKYISDGTYNNPYYRIALHRKYNNRQHQRLKELSRIKPHTYYVAPEFNSLDDFNTAFLARQIYRNSRLIQLTDCDDIIDGEQHYITFQAGNPGWALHSEMKRYEKSFFGRDMETLYRNSAQEWKLINKTFAENLFAETKGVVKRIIEVEEPNWREAILPILDFNAEEAPQKEVLLKISEILSIFLGTTLVIVGTTEQAKTG